MNSDKITITNEFMDVWFDILNHHLFDNILVKPPLIAAHIKKVWGWVMIGDDGTIQELRMHYKQPSLKHFVNVLAHEMVHIWQVQILDDTGSHNKHFYSWRSRLNEFNIQLKRCL